VDFLHIHAKNPDQWACFRSLQGIIEPSVRIHIYEYLYRFMREAQQTPRSRGHFVSDGTLVNFCMNMQKFRLTGLLWEFARYNRTSGSQPLVRNLWFATSGSQPLVRNLWFAFIPFYARSATNSKVCSGKVFDSGSVPLSFAPRGRGMDPSQTINHTPPQSGRGMVVLVRYLTQGPYPLVSPQGAGVWTLRKQSNLKTIKKNNPVVNYIVI
jgi:hypothetical protein